MTVASYRAESASPEGDCGKVMTPFMHKLKIWSENNGKYEVDDNKHDLSRQWMEEFIDFETFVLKEDIPFGEKQLDLFMPIRVR